jgi:hypothetical protein
MNQTQLLHKDSVNGNISVKTAVLREMVDDPGSPVGMQEQGKESLYDL